MSEQRILSFVPHGEHHAAFMGTHLVGSVRPRGAGGAEWICFLARDNVWHPARDIDGAKLALTYHVVDWYEAAHQPLAEGQGERIARQARVP